MTEHALAQAAPTPVATAEVTAPASTPDPLASAAQAYLAAVAPINAVGDVVFSEEDALPDAPYSAHVPYERRWLTALQHFDTTIHGIAWPSSVQTQADELYAAVEDEIGAEQGFLADPNATTWDALGAALSGGASASADIRGALHLPTLGNGTAPTA